MRRKSFPFAHQSSSYKTFRLTLESREVGGGAGNLFVCLSLLETIINYGDCQSRTERGEDWGPADRSGYRGGGRGGHQQYNYGQPVLSCPPVLGGNISILGNSAKTPENIPGWAAATRMLWQEAKTGPGNLEQDYVNWMCLTSVTGLWLTSSWENLDNYFPLVTIFVLNNLFKLSIITILLQDCPSPV